MKIDIITIFPEMFDSVLNASILKRAAQKKKLKARALNLRDFASGKHKNVDDTPYGGGCGMVMKIEPVIAALKSIRGYKKARKIIFTPAGRVFNQKKAVELSKEKHLILLCGHYEGYDERLVQFFDEEISIGDYVLTGGELPAMSVIDAVTRLLPGVLGNEDSAKQDSFMDGLLDYPHFTRPADWKGLKVPEVLLNGNHAKINEWRKKEAEKRTRERRPDLERK
ncbi:MAG: tRNA (guanosine(37)-N1)-methyltransferase TrmD [Candidatus Firestonebacteria bacterium]